MKEKIKQILNKKWDIPGTRHVNKALLSFGIAEKVFFYTVSAIMIISGLVLLKQANDKFLVDVPDKGGYLNEGIIGSPRFVNPVLATSDVDRDLSFLLYSGLMKISTSGELIPDMAKDYNISDDGLTYTFNLKDDLTFHDGVKITSDDIEFTIKKIQDGSIKSPKRASFYDVGVEKVNDSQIKFILKKPYSPFLENLTVGILPKHLWNNLDSDQFPLSQYNVEPIGSGPYKVNKMQTLNKNMLLVPTYYELVPFNNYALGRPFINNLTIRFYRDEKTLISAYNSGEIESINSISPENMATVKKQTGAEIKISPLPRIFAVFFNQNQSEVLANKEVRVALDMTADRKEMVDQVLGGYGKPLHGPIPPGMEGSDGSDYSNISNAVDIDGAKAVLAKAGWLMNTKTGILEKKINKKKTIQLSFSISTLNAPDLTKDAEILKNNWEKLGARVDIKEFELGDLQQNIIRPRKFDALLYGEVVGRDMDFFAFWHSSQRNDPGLNVAMYTNSKVDKLLDDARKTLDLSARVSKYQEFESEINKDVPAVFLYSPEFIYIVPEKVKSADIGVITMPFERFMSINTWYIETNKVWKIFN